MIGLGFVGVANALALAKNHSVFAMDIDATKVDLINSKVNPIDDPIADNFIKSENLELTATTDLRIAVKDAEYVVISTPTDYDERAQFFDTRSLENIISSSLSISPNSAIVIKSTIPIGFVERMRLELGSNKIFFAPEFLREGFALHDTLYPSRIVIGSQTVEAKRFSEIMQRCSIDQNAPVILTNASEAECIKLFSNAHLAMRVAFFNELDNFTITHGLDSSDIIHGVCLDPRIGQHYNNPSFGYGGYCLPKDTKQLTSNYRDIPQKLISAISESNDTRIKFIIDDILAHKPKTIGFYFLSMKSGSSNLRSSATLEIARKVVEKDIEVLIYEPTLEENHYLFSHTVSDLCYLTEKADLIVANRIDNNLAPFKQKVYTRDIFGTE